MTIERRNPDRLLQKELARKEFFTLLQTTQMRVAKLCSQQPFTDERIDVMKASPNRDLPDEYEFDVMDGNCNE